MRQQLFEGINGAMPFIVDRTKSSFVTETRNGTSFTRIPGRFSICDSVNGNNRRYPKRVWEKNLAEGSVLRQSIAKNAAFGLLEHPANGQISLQSPICILVVEAKIQPSSQAGQLDEVVGEIVVLNTAEGQKLSALIEAGYNPLVSSRGFGSVIKASDGIDEVQDDYVCEGWDVVLRPSFEKAELWPNRGESKVQPQPKTEALSTPETPATAPAVVPPPAPPKQTIESKPPGNKLMNINEIKSRIAAVRGQKVPGDPARFAEGLAEMHAIHDDIAVFVSEDAKRSYQGQRLHEEVQGLERAWSAVATAPSKENRRISENYVKVLRVTKLIAEAAGATRKKLAEAITQKADQLQLIEELTERGQAWVRVADNRKAELADTQHKLDVACEALDIIAAQYHEDMTEMGRRVITLEFAEKAQTPEIQKLLKEAKKPSDIIAIREKLEPPKPAEGKDGQPGAKVEGKDDGKPAATTPAAPAPQAPVSAPAAEGTPSLGEAKVLVPSTRSITESTEMVKRLSASHTSKA